MRVKETPSLLFRFCKKLGDYVVQGNGEQPWSFFKGGLQRQVAV